MAAEQYVVGILVIIGLIFNTLGAISLYRFPDVYTRLHGTDTKKLHREY